MLDPHGNFSRQTWPNAHGHSTVNEEFELLLRSIASRKTLESTDHGDALPLVFWIFSDDDIANVVPPPAISWFINHSKYVNISIINHSEIWFVDLATERFSSLGHHLVSIPLNHHSEPLLTIVDHGNYQHPKTQVFSRAKKMTIASGVHRVHLWVLVNFNDLGIAVNRW